MEECICNVWGCDRENRSTEKQEFARQVTDIRALQAHAIDPLIHLFTSNSNSLIFTDKYKLSPSAKAAQATKTFETLTVSLLFL